MDILIHKELLGMSTHALLKDSMLKWTDVEECDFVYGDKHSPKSISPLLKLFDIEISSLVPESFKKAMAVCTNNQPPWQLVMPKKLYSKNFKKMISDLIAAEQVIKKSNYTTVFQHSNSVMSLLKPAALDVDLCNRILKNEDNHIVRAILKGSEKGFCSIPIYDRVSTKTGRLTIKGGPQVLTLKKEYRSIFKPSSPTAKLYEIDFSSREPRVASNIAKRSPGQDVYLSFMEYAGISITRDAAKLAVLCSLYGAGKYNLQSQLKKQNSDVTADFLIRKVKEYFQVPGLLASLKKQAKDSGMIENYFGRPIAVDDARDSVLVNNYLQSTAVDVSLLGFSEFCSALDGKISPLFIIHDALFFEAEDNYLGEVQHYLDSGFFCEGLGSFPLTITEFKV